MNKQFKLLSNNKNIDLIPYIKDYIKQYSNTEILIGTDSQNSRKETVYASCVVLYRPGLGGHVLYCKYNINREKENRIRLLNEVWFSIEIAEYIKNETNIRASFIDLDINNDKKYQSNEVLSAAVGLTEAYGYESRVKKSNNTPYVSYICDTICK